MGVFTSRLKLGVFSVSFYMRLHVVAITVGLRVW